MSSHDLAHSAEVTRAPQPLPAARRPTGSLRGLRLLVGYLVLRDRAALESLVDGPARCGPALLACELVFRGVVLARASERVRLRLEMVLAAHLGRRLLALVPRSLYRIALAFETERERLDEDALFALLLVLHTHPSHGARPIEERVADEIEQRRRPRP